MVEMRITFNYSYVKENMPGSFMELMTEIHNYLAFLDHKCFLQFDIKNAYWSIVQHPQDRFIYAFYVSTLGEVQPTRMPQGTNAAGYTMNKFMLNFLGYCHGQRRRRGRRRGRRQEQWFIMKTRYSD